MGGDCMKIRPLGNRAVISLIEESNETYQNGIIIPDTVKGMVKRGKVVAVGDRDTSRLRVDEVIIFSENTGLSIKLVNENYLVIDEEDILAVIDN